MTRFVLAFSSFFRLLFGGKLHPKAADYLPESAKPALPEAKSDEPAKKVETKSDDKPKKRKGPSDDLKKAQRDGALTLMGLLQREGRLVDFLQESLDDHGDEDIGAAVRDIHRGCKKVLEGQFEIEAVMPGKEDDSISVPKGFDPAEIKLIGEVSGDPPFKGLLRHHGWRATKVKLPELSAGVDRHVLAPAEVEVKG